MGMSQFLVGSPLVSKPARIWQQQGSQSSADCRNTYKLCLIPKATPQGTGVIVVVVVRESCPRLCFRKTKRKQQQHPNIAVQHPNIAVQHSIAESKASVPLVTIDLVPHPGEREAAHLCVSPGLIAAQIPLSGFW